MSRFSSRFLTATLFVLMGAIGTASAQPLPAGWATADIGVTGASGTATATGSTFQLQGAGLDVWGTSDQFRFAYRSLTGDGVLVARVAMVQNVHAWTKAGVMMRDTLDAKSKHAFMLVSPGKGLAFQRRPATAGTSVNTSGGSGTAPAWVKIERAGNLFTASRSLDGVTWTIVGTQTIAMGATIQVGVALGSHVAGTLASASFEQVSVTGVLPSGWSTGDVGNVGAAGNATHTDGTFTVDGAGLDVWGTSDQFHFTHRALTGNGVIVARVAGIERVNAWTKAGVMMRETAAGNARHAFMLVSPGKGAAFQRRPLTGGTSVHTSGGAGTAPSYVKLQREGDTFTAAISADGSAWTVVGTQTIAMAQTIRVGLAVGSHVTGNLATASFDHVVVTEAQPPTGQQGEQGSEPEPPVGPPGTGEPPQDPTTGPVTLRLLHWNAHHGGRRTDGVYDPAGFAAWVARFQPDVVTLNEIDTVAQADTLMTHLRAGLPGQTWHRYYLGHMKGNMIVSRFPLDATSTCVVNAADDRRVAHVNVLVNGRAINVWNAHLSLDSSAERTAETRALQACENSWPEARIAAGDYNMQAGSAEYNSMLEGHVDAWKAAKALGTARNYTGNCDGCTKNSRIDYVFTSKGASFLTLKSAEIFDTRNAQGVMASDHKPMLVVYEVR